MTAHNAISRTTPRTRFGAGAMLLLAIILFQWLFMAPTHAASGENADSIFSLKEMTPVMSFNLKVANDTGDRAWEKRRPQVSAIVADYRPLFIGTQEGLRNQLEDLKRDLPDYRALGVSRRGDSTDEHTAIFYDSTRAKPLENGEFWLSSTPGRAGTILAGDGHPRMVTWAAFNVEGKDKPTYVFNTHLALDESVAVKQAGIFLNQLAQIAPKDSEILITGDFNARRGGAVWNRFAEAGFADALQLADYEGGPKHTSHCWAGQDADQQKRRLEREGHKVEMVDWIFHRNGDKAISRPLLAQVIDSHEGGVYPSDHYPLVLTTLGQAKAETVASNPAAPLRTRPDAPISLTATLDNGGKRGIVPLQLREDGEVTQTRWIPLEANAQKPVTFSTRLYASGEHSLAIGALEPVKVDVSAAPSRISYDDLYLDPYPKAGVETPIFGKVRNAGGKQDVAIVELKVDGGIAVSEGADLKPGQSRELSFSHVFPEEGAYAVSLGDREQEVNVMRDLGTQWRFAKGDDAARSKADFDDKNWQPVDVPAPWEKHSGYTEDNVFGWYRNALVIPKEWEGRPVRVILGQVDDADQTFFNGQQIGAGGHMPDDKEGYSSAAFTVRSYTIPPELIKYGEANSLSVRVFDGLGDGGMAKGPIGMLPLKGKAVSKWQDSVKEQRAAAERSGNQR